MARFECNVGGGGGGGAEVAYDRITNATTNTSYNFTMTQGLVTIFCGTSNSSIQFGLYIGWLENGTITTLADRRSASTAQVNVSYSNRTLTVKFTGGTYAVYNTILVCGDLVS